MEFVEHPKIHNFQDLTGKEYNRLMVLGYIGKNNNRQSIWYCKCECGNIIKALSSNLKKGNTKSCGCYNIEKLKERRTTHGMIQTSEYKTYHLAKDRCINSNNISYKNYGGRGIEFKFKSFEEFYSEIGKKTNKTQTLDRIDVNGHYEKGNVRWATQKEQQNNRCNNILITYEGETKTLKQWCEELNLNYSKTYWRIKKRNLSTQKAFNPI